MAMGLGLENLAQIIHMDKQRMFAEECFIRSIELAQHQPPGETTNGFLRGTHTQHLVSRHLVVTLAVHPLRLTVQWI